MVAIIQFAKVAAYVHSRTHVSSAELSSQSQAALFRGSSQLKLYTYVEHSVYKIVPVG